MNRQTLVALLLAAVAALLVYYYLSEKEAAVKADVTPLKVLVAKKPIGRGAALTGDRILVDEIPGAYVMPGAIASPTREGLLAQWKAYKGQFAVVPIAKGEQILPNKLSKILPGFAGVVPEGMRIIALGFDPAAAVGGHIKPGNHVDLIGTFEHQFRGEKRITTVLLAQNLLVTSVGSETTADAPKSAEAGASGGSLTISLAVSPEDALRLSLAESEGSLKIMLRSVGDENVADLSEQNLKTLLGPLLRAKQDDIAPAKRGVQIIRGLQ
ncbi:MAG: Flp pilus assembly protein CpaB [candidate division FCPU426 bacterium]